MPVSRPMPMLGSMADQPDADFLALQEALLGRFVLERELGRGGMGIVYLARDIRLDRPVALKLLPSSLSDRPELRERFLREARTAARLSHPNIVPIHAVEELGDYVFIVMAYIEGQTLGERIRERGPLPPSRARRVVQEVAWALAYAHAQGVVHRDVKPDNILLEERTNRALVTDFGIAMVMEEESLTGSHDVLGTAEFMSPEQASGRTVDVRSDLYSLGVVGHYVLSGRLPFDGRTPAATLAQHLTRPAPSLTTLAPETPTPLARALDRCLSKEPADRFSDGEELVEALDRSSQPRHEVPVPLRVFIKQILERFRGWGWFVFALLWAVPPIIMGMRTGELSLMLGYLAMALGLGVVPLGMLAVMSRKLLRSGYGRQDLIQALENDVELRREERTFEFGGKETWVDRVARGVAATGLGAFVVGTASLFVFDWSTVPLAVRGILAWTMGGGLFAGSAAAFLAAKRHEQRIHVPGERWLKFWKSKLGRWFFRATGLGLKRLPTPDAVHRPTSMAIGMAAERLYDELPKELRREFPELRTVVRSLEDHARTIRSRVDALDRALSRSQERGATDLRGPAAPLPEIREARAQVVRNLRSARDLAAERLDEVVGVLERIRLQLLHLQAGSGSFEGMTADLSAARAISSDAHRLVQAQREVDELLDAPSLHNLTDTPTPTPA